VKHVLPIFLFIHTTIGAQIWVNDNWGVQFGLSFQFGTHVQQIGVKAQGYYTDYFAQANAGILTTFNFGNLGGRKFYPETRINTGLVLLGGKKDNIPRFILDGLNHQTGYQYGIAYNHLWYFDNVGTSQRSGGMGFHVQQFSVLLENDFYAGQGKDKFRTAHLQMNYHTAYLNFGLNAQLWTGETEGAKKQVTDEGVAFKNISDLPYGKTSHGAFYFSLDYLFLFGNVGSIDLGYDQEKIRHVLQNKFMHEKKFVPTKWRKPNPDYPMLDEVGEPILDNRKAKKGRIYLQYGNNRNWSY
jgi:hypothetical protein